MINPKVFIKANIYQPVVATPAVGVNDAGRIGFASDNCLQSGLGGIGHDLGIDAVPALEQSEDYGLATGTPSAFAPHALGAEVRLISLQLATPGRLRSTSLGHAHTQALVNGVGAAHRQATQGSTISSSQIHGEQTQQIPEFSLTDFGTAEIPVFTNHFRKLAHALHVFAS